jgi:hypothetical protein
MPYYENDDYSRQSADERDAKPERRFSRFFSYITVGDFEREFVKQLSS